MNRRPPFWLWPNLLSLDAPLVGVIWMWIMAKAMRVLYVETYAYWMLAAAIWCVYVIDRIWDVWRNEGSTKGLSSRHEFHWKYRKYLLSAVFAVVIVCVYASINIISETLLSAGVAGVLLVIIYLLVAKLDKGDVTYFKNFIAGITFAYGVAAPIVVESIQIDYGLSDIVYHPKEVIQGAADYSMLDALGNSITNVGKMLFSYLGGVMGVTMMPFVLGLLCTLNITAIDLWESSRRTDDPDEKEAYGATLGIGLTILVGFTVYLAAFKMTEYERPFCYAIMIGAACLQLINRKRSMFYLDAQRVLADLALIVPWPLVWMMAEEGLVSF